MTRSFADIAASRFSCRAFLPTMPKREVMMRALEAARTAPSGANLQPGRFVVLKGKPFEALKDALTAAAEAGPPEPSTYDYFPAPMPAVFKNRQRESGFALYHALGIERSDRKARRDQFMHNYRFFDAPMGMVVTIHKRMGAGCYMDLGMALQTLFLALEAEGLAAVGLGSLANYGSAAHRALALPEDELVVCGIAVGYADHAKAVNQYRTSRAGLEEFAEFRGFDVDEGG